MGWMTVLHVTSSWRQVALGSPRLWTRLECLDIPPQLMTKVVLNSRNLPLDVRIHDCERDLRGQQIQDSTATDVRRNWLCAPVITRAEKLSIVVEGNTFVSWMRALRVSAPALKDLELEAVCVDDEPCRLESTIFAGEVRPLLTALSLTAVLPGWKSRLFSANLTKLRLSFGKVVIDIFDDDSTNMLPTVSALKRILSPMRGLAELYLHNLFPRGERGVVEQPLTLPHTLKVFECTCDDWDMLTEWMPNVWRYLKVPSGAVVVCEAFIDALDDNLSTISHNLLQPFAEVDNTTHPARELYLSRHTLSLRYSAQPRSGWTWRWPDEPWNIDERLVPTMSVIREDLVYDKESGSRHVRTWATMKPVVLVDLVSTDTIEAIYLSSDVMHHYATPAKWYACFLDADNVERIAIPFINSLALLSALAHQTDGERVFLLPRLHTIVVHPGNQYRKGADVHHGAVDLSLVHLIELRRREGIPIRELLVDRTIESWDVWGRIRESVTVNFFE